MRRALGIWSATSLLVCLGTLGRAQHGPDVPDVVTRFCAECHSGEDPRRGLSVAELFAADAPAERRQLALLRVRSRTMPPPDAEQRPDRAARDELQRAFAALLPAAPGDRIPTARRLARVEYQRTVADLFGVRIQDLDRLPEDVVAYGFDNVGDVATTTATTLEAWLGVAQQTAAAVLADPAATARLFATDTPLATTLPPFLARAFRRPVTGDEVATRLRLHAEQLAAGRDQTAARAAVLQSILASPAFLLRSEAGRDGAPAELTAYELATRLAYFLQATLPDPGLWQAAQDGSLLQPGQPLAHARRLLQAGSRPFVERFFGQWLRADLVLSANADFRRYPEIWNGNLRPAFREELLAFCQALVDQDLPVTALLDADFTFANDVLARHYGLPEVAGSHFRRVPVPDRRRGGVLGMGAMLMASSYPLRTSPVRRGQWILDLLLDLAPPPPPANVGSLPADDTPQGDRSLRAQLEHHRQKASCRSCHAMLDPLGLALENYDVLGRWRSELHGQPIDARAELPDGSVVDGPVALKDALLAAPEDFLRALCSRLLVYAVGRPMLPADEPELQRLVAGLLPGDRRFATVLAAVVESPLFLRRDPEASR